MTRKWTVHIPQSMQQHGGAAKTAQRRELERPAAGKIEPQHEPAASRAFDRQEQPRDEGSSARGSD
jgi:hypothetical protein